MTDHTHASCAIGTASVGGDGALSTPVRFASTATPAELPAPERLASAKFSSPSTMELEFADGIRGLLAIERLDMPMDRIRWSTAAASASGYLMTVEGAKGETIPIDSSVLRYLIDEEYARSTDAKLKRLQFAADELDQIVGENPPPPEWLAQRSPNLTRESWK